MPIRTVVTLLTGSEFLALYTSNQLDDTIRSWVAACTRHHVDSTILILMHGIYSLVQLEATHALQQRRAARDEAQATGAPTPTNTRPKVKPLQKLTEVDAIIAKLWFQTKGKVRFKIVSHTPDS